MIVDTRFRYEVVYCPFLIPPDAPERGDKKLLSERDSSKRLPDDIRDTGIIMAVPQ